MVYQVLARANAQAAWEPYESMTRDPMRVLTLLQKAVGLFAEVTVIQAESAALLREQAQLLRAGEPSGQEACPLPSLTATPRISLVGATIERTRWAIEQGPGGDHDMPYRFEAPASEHLLARWAQLMVAARHQAGEQAGLPDTLAELANSLDGAEMVAVVDDDAAASASVILPSERIS